MDARFKRIGKSIGLFAALILIGAGCAGEAPPSLELTQTTFEAGDQITVTFSASEDYDSSAWVGIIPSNIAHGSETVNDDHDVEYEYLNKETEGTLTFTAPTQPGSYDLRMHDNDGGGLEVASVSFSVSAPENEVEPTLTLSETTFASGDEISVDFTAPSFYDTSAWVGIVPSDIEHGDEVVNDENDIDFDYLSQRTEGTLIFTAPDEVGSYDLRMNDTDSAGEEVASVTFEVSEAGEDEE